MAGIARIGKGVLAAVALLAIVVGTPVLLVRIGRPLDAVWWLLRRSGGPGDGPGSDGGPDLFDVLFSRDDGTVFLGLLSVVAWLVWAVITVCIVVEAVNAARSLGRRPRTPIRLPGLRVPQAVAAGLVLAAVSMVVAPVRLAATPDDSGTATPPPSQVAVVTAPTNVPVADPGGAADRTTRTDDRGVLTVHDVAAGDHLWALAEQYYDDGGQWRAIARANPVLRHHGPDDLQVGWRLVVPRLDAAGAPSGEGYVVAADGDTLSSLAAEHLGSQRRWIDLYDVNRTVLSDPDELAAGTVLLLPGSDSRTAQHTATGDRTAGQDRAATQQRRAVDVPPVAGEAPATSTGHGSTSAGTSEEPSTRVDPTGTDAVEDVEEAIDPLSVTRGVGGMLAAAMLAGLAVRRIHQLRVRPVGRRISHPGPTGARLAQSFARGQRRDAMLAVDRAMRLLAAHCRAAAMPPPRLQQVHVGRALEMTFGDAVADAPAPFTVDGRVWTIADIAGWLATEDPHPEEVRPWPAVVTIGTTPDDEVVLVNLEDVATLGCDRSPTTAWGTTAAESRTDAAGTDDPDEEPQVDGVLTAIACELSFQPWAAGTRTVVLVDDRDDADWVAALDSPDITVASDADAVIGRLEQRAEAQRAELDGRWGPARRLDPDQADAWAADVVVVLGTLTPTQRARLCRVVDGAGRTTQAVVLVGTDDTRAGLHLDATGAHLELPSPLRHPAPPVTTRPGAAAPTSVEALRPHHVAAGVAVDLTDLLVGTSGPTTPAPWWAGSTVAPPASAVPVDLTATTAAPVSAEPAADDDAGTESTAGEGKSSDEPPVDPESERAVGMRALHGRRARAGDDDATASMLGVPPARAQGPGVPRAEGTSMHDADRGGSADATVVRLPTAREVRERTGRGDNGAGTTAAPGRSADGGKPVDPTSPYPHDRQEVPTVTDHADESSETPLVQLLGPIDLVGAQGTPPTRARKQCIEYCAWLLEHPAATATAMASALVVAEGTRRSNMSRLRSWLGEGEDGPYLPDAYSGRISLHDSVSSDWHHLQLLVGRGVDRAGDGALVAALELVRGAPLADAAPGQWIWAEELRTDIASVIRDIGVELSGRALTAGNPDLARWAAARALVAAPSDELLLGQRIRTEHAAGNRREVDRLAMQLATQSRRLGVDLADETVELLQFVVEGAVRAREV